MQLDNTAWQQQRQTQLAEQAAQQARQQQQLFGQGQATQGQGQAELQQQQLQQLQRIQQLQQQQRQQQTFAFAGGAAVSAAQIGGGGGYAQQQAAGASADQNQMAMKRALIAKLLAQRKQQQQQQQLAQQRGQGQETAFAAQGLTREQQVAAVQQLMAQQRSGGGSSAVGASALGGGGLSGGAASTAAANADPANPFGQTSAGSQAGTSAATNIAAALMNQQKALRMEAIKQQQSAQQQALVAQEKEKELRLAQAAAQAQAMTNQQLLAQLHQAQAALKQHQMQSSSGEDPSGGLMAAASEGGEAATGGGHRHHRKSGGGASVAASGGGGGDVVGVKNPFATAVANPHPIKGAGKLSKAELAKDMPDMKRISLHPKCETAPIRVDDNNRTSGAQCRVRDLHPTPNCRDCDAGYEQGGITDCAGYAWVTTSGPGQKYMHMASIVALLDGTLIVAWQQATEREGDGDQHIMLANSPDAGRSWGKHRRLFQEDEEANTAGGPGPQWGPAMIRSEKGTINLFYSQSQSCKVVTRENGWTPGGNVLMTTSVDGIEWTMPVVLAEQGGGFPLVTANPPVVMRAGMGSTNWALPVWREAPRKSNCNATEMAAEMPAGLSAGVLRGDMACHQEIHRMRQLCRACKMLVGRAFESCVSRKCPKAEDSEKQCGSRNWLEQMALSSNNTWLIEGTVVRYGNKDLVQFFRTAVGKVYRAESNDGGINWTKAEPVDLPNPNSKLNAIVLSDGQTVIAYNSHDRTGGLKLMRVNLTLAISPDRGKTWSRLANLEIVAGSHVWHVSAPIQRPMIHYPTMMQRGCTLYVAYSVTFKDNATPEGETAGIRLARIDLSLTRRRCQHSRCKKMKEEREEIGMNMLNGGVTAITGMEGFMFDNAGAGAGAALSGGVGGVGGGGGVSALGMGAGAGGTGLGGFRAGEASDGISSKLRTRGGGVGGDGGQVVTSGEGVAAWNGGGGGGGGGGDGGSDTNDGGGGEGDGSDVSR